MKIKILQETYNNLLRESFNGKTYISIDIQPEYENGMRYDISEFTEFLNSNYQDFSQLIFLYNGEDLGMVSESEYKQWLLEYGLDESIIYSASFFDKGYAFFRYCMDSYVDHHEIVDLVRYMRDNNIHDTRDFDEEIWDDFQEKHNYSESEVRELLEYADDMIYIPDVMDYLSNKSNIVITGGGVNECFKEIEIALDALGKPYSVHKKFNY